MQAMNLVGSPAERTKLQDAIAHAETLERKAEKSGDAQDFVAASTAYGNAAYLAHNVGISSDRPKDERDRAYQLGVSLNKLSDKCKKRSDEIIRAGYTARRAKWSERETLDRSGHPPDSLNVLDEHSGFTAVTMPRSWASHLREEYRAGKYLSRHHTRSSIGGQTIWRPSSWLKKGTTGRLVDHAPNSFFQTNDDVTVAIYKVPGYPNPVAVWFDNKTGKRIA
jgi:hypothetical protein